MNKDIIQPPEQCNVAIIGAGPSGLAAATELKKLGVESVIVLEREAQAGGIPRHCAHFPFGLGEFKRLYNGKRYANELSNRAIKSGVIVCLKSSVIAINKGGILELSTPAGICTLIAQKVIICTGVRETPRANRLISGQRPMGVLTSGALQSIIYLKHKSPFERPIIIGTEIVSFSSLLSCRYAGIQPVAMLEKNSRITAKWGLQVLAKMFGVPVFYNTCLGNIIGKKEVEAVEINIECSPLKRKSEVIKKVIPCDGVIFTGEFVAESSLLRMGHLDVDPSTGNPVIDQFGRCSDSDYFATGNMTHPVETAGYCWKQGLQTAQQVYASLKGELDQYQRRINVISTSPIIKYIIPQILALTVKGDYQSGKHIAMDCFQIRVSKAVKGQLSIRSGAKTLVQKKINTLPERRINLKLPYSILIEKDDADIPLQLHFESTCR